MEIDKNQRTNSYDDEQLLSETSLSSDCEMKADDTIFARTVEGYY